MIHRHKYKYNIIIIMKKNIIKYKIYFIIV